MEKSSSQLYVGMDGIGLDGWLSKVVGSLRAPSAPIIDIDQWVILQDSTILTSSMYIAHRRILPCLNIPTRSFIQNVDFARFVVMKT